MKPPSWHPLLKDSTPTKDSTPVKDGTPFLRMAPSAKDDTPC